MKIKLHTWLAFCLFCVSAVFLVGLFVLVNQKIEDSLLQRTIDQLNSVNVLKKNLLVQALEDRRSEARHIINYHQSHQSTRSDLLDALSEIEGLNRVQFRPTPSDTDESKQFQCQLELDGPYFVFYFTLEGLQAVLQFEVQHLAEVLKERTGLGISGESYLVGQNLRMLSESRFYPDTNPREFLADTEGVSRALDGEIGHGRYPDYRGVPVFGAFRPLSYDSVMLVLLTEIDVSEAMAPIQELRNGLIVLLAILLVPTFFVSAILARILARPVKKLNILANGLSQGTLPPIEQPNTFIAEYATIATAVNQLIEALKSTVSFADKIGKGDMQAPYSALSDKDELGNAVLKMRDELIRLDEEKNALERQAKLNLLQGQEKERERVARDLHDGMGSLLTTMKLKLSNSGMLDQDADLLELMDRTIAEARSLARNLMPAVLIDFGLNEALAQLAKGINESSDIKAYYSYDKAEEALELDKNMQVYIYRIAQEVLNNALKHAECTEIWISFTEFDDEVVLFIKDNGKGLPKDQSSSGLGFKNIRERANLLQGELFVESDKSGTSFEVKIPLH